MECKYVISEEIDDLLVGTVFYGKWLRKSLDK